VGVISVVRSPAPYYRRVVSDAGKHTKEVLQTHVLFAVALVAAFLAVVALFGFQLGPNETPVEIAASLVLTLIGSVLVFFCVFVAQLVLAPRRLHDDLLGNLDDLQLELEAERTLRVAAENRELPRLAVETQARELREILKSCGDWAASDEAFAAAERTLSRWAERANAAVDLHAQRFLAGLHTEEPIDKPARQFGLNLYVDQERTLGNRAQWLEDWARRRVGELDAIARAMAGENRG